MSTMTVGRPMRSALPRRVRLDVASWLVLRQALLTDSPATDVPAELAPAAFGRPADDWLTGEERDHAWLRLVEARLATDIPGSDTLAVVHPALAAGLGTLLRAPLRVVMHAWQEHTGILQTLAVDGTHAVAVSRRLQEDTAPAAPATAEEGRATRPDLRLVQEGTVEVAFLPAGSVINQISRALPTGSGRIVRTEGEPVTLGWAAAQPVGEALRTGRQDAVPHLAELPAEHLSLLGSACTEYAGGAQVTIHHTAPVARAGCPAVFTGLWVWTGSDVAEVLRADGEQITLQRTSEHRVRRRLVSALTTPLAAGTAFAA